jgi:hypothetical protein
MLTALFGIVSVGCQEKQATHVLLYASLFIEATAQKKQPQTTKQISDGGISSQISDLYMSLCHETS